MIMQKTFSFYGIHSNSIQAKFFIMFYRLFVRGMAAVLGMTVSRVKKRFRLVRVLLQYLVIRFFAVF